jgi:hypothetical protein
VRVRHFRRNTVSTAATHSRTLSTCTCRRATDQATTELGDQNRADAPALLMLMFGGLNGLRRGHDAPHPYSTCTLGLLPSRSVCLVPVAHRITDGARLATPADVRKRAIIGLYVLWLFTAVDRPRRLLAMPANGPRSCCRF